jgi:hypothetical protein
VRAVTAKVRLEADRAEIARFVHACFRYADDGTHAVLRTFVEGSSEVLASVRVPLNGTGLDPLIDHAAHQATKAANSARSAVFAPPVATFVGPRTRERDLGNGLVLTVEADFAPATARRNLEYLLGSATLVVASGGQWADPETGAVEDKLHLHWRCREPTRSGPEHATLKQARRLACAFVGGDTTAISLVHPLRWAGSYHRKTEPRLARIVGHRPDVEIESAEVIELLQPLVPAQRRSRSAPTGAPLPPQLTDGDLLALGETIANADREWADWNRLGMALFAASGGSDAGLAAFDCFSRQSAKYDTDETQRRWDHYRQCPPDRLGPGTLVYEARQVEPAFRLPSLGPGASEQEGSAKRGGTSHSSENGPGAADPSERVESGPEGRGGADTKDNDRRPRIRLRGGGLAEHTRDAERILAAQTRRAPFGGVYARGSMLVRPVRLRDGRDAGGVRRAAGSLALLPTDDDFLRLELTRLVHLQRFDKRCEDWVDVDAPAALARSLLAAVPWEKLPALTGIVETPTLRSDGTLLDRPGYDEQTGLLFDPGGVVFPSIPARPTRPQAEAARDLLLEVIKDFPFADEASRSVAMAAFITALIRRSLRSAPLFAFSAPKMASGKTLLASCVGYIATGRAPAMMTQGDDSESERKRLFALLLEGVPIIVIDNLERPLASDALCSILTEPVFSDRLLGVSRTASVPTNTLLLATGNNVVLEGDLTTRALVCALDPQCEHPEERRFEINLHEAVPARRGELVAAALTIPLAYLAAGAPPQGLPPFGRFEAWARWCREPLAWLDMADPCASRQRIETRDPVRGILRPLLTAWHAAFGDTVQTVADVVALTTVTQERADGTTSTPRPDDKLLDLRKALEAVAAQGREINTRRLGNFIAKHERRVEAGMRFERAGDRSGVALWRVVTVNEVVGSKGFVGSDDTPTRESQPTENDSFTKQCGTNPRNHPNPRRSANQWEGSL